MESMDLQQLEAMFLLHLPPHTPNKSHDRQSQAPPEAAANSAIASTTNTIGDAKSFDFITPILNIAAKSGSTI